MSLNALLQAILLQVRARRSPQVGYLSNKSGTSAQIISLPSGGGALRGIGETFSPDLHTGTGNFTVPLALPLGRSGFQPQLNLVYSTGNGNGPFGLGWSLSIPGVSRKTAKGVPRYDDALDTFILSGAEDLAPVPGGAAGVTRYRPRTEGLFARIQHQHDAKNDYWRVQSKDGLISIYGTPGPEQAVPNWQDPAVIADPADRTKIFAWKLTRTVDPFGNRIEYLYERDPVWIEGPHQWDQLYLSQIRYIDYGDPITPQFLVTIHFIYDDRPDPFSEYRPGFELRTVRRCTQIDLFTHHNTDTLARTYHFIYLDQRDLPIAQRPLNGVSLLSQVRVVGHDGEHTEELPPLEFGYTRFEPARRDFFPVTGPDMPPGSLARPDYELADLLGNGLPDVLEMNGLVRYWRNLGGGQFDRPRPMRDAPAGLALADPGVQLIDADGDGRIDLLTTIDGLAGYFPLRFNGQWDRHSFRRYRQTPSFSLEDPEVRLVDLDGDGVTDAVRSGGRFECFFNDPKEGWNHTRRVERQALESFPNINFSDPHVKWADMTGDGLQDIVLVHDGNVEYWPNRGHGNWAQRISMRKSPRLPYGYDPGRVLVGDVDGDGLADLVYVEDTQVRLWINQAGNSWSDPLIIQGTPSVSDMDAVRLIDLLGAGISGILWSADANGLSRSSMFFLDFTGGSKPYLLQEMDNHMGAMTRVTYAPSTRFYREDQQDPKTRWRTSLPFPVQVVTYVEVIDELSKGKLTTEYRYHHGYWDGGEREFRGFGMVEQFDTETFEQYNAAGLHGEIDFTSVEKIHFSPPTYTKTWFHQGPVGDEFGEWEELDYSSDFWPGDPPALTRPQSMTDLLKALPRRVKRDALRALRGSILRTELYALDSTALQERPYTVTESLFGLREEAAPGVDEQERLPIFYPHLLAQRTTQWERGDEPMTQFTFTDSEDYDAYGQPRRQTQVACPRRWRKLADKPSQTGMTEQERRFLATRTVTAYAQRDDEQLFIVDRVARTTTYEIESDGNELLLELKELPDGNPKLRIIGQALNFYDGEPFTGLPGGQMGKHGALMRTETLVLDEQSLAEAYGSEIPPYLSPDGIPTWSGDYPQAFRESLPISSPSDPTRPGLVVTPLGYGFADGAASLPYAHGYFVATERRRYDFQEAQGSGRGLLRTILDPLGRATTIAYDAFDLLPTAVTDPVGLQTKAIYNYRVLQPIQVADPNDNQQTFGFSPLGLPAWTAVTGNDGQGDTSEAPGVRFIYDFLAFVESPPTARQPISVRTIQRVHHTNDLDVPLPERDETVETVEYSDGFGRLLQTRTQAEEVIFGDPTFGGGVLPTEQNHLDSTKPVVGVENTDADNPNVAVSGWQIYDNKGQVVVKYEPFFSTGWEYASPQDHQFGQKATMFYDPRGQVIRTTNPDGSEQRVIYGVPTALDQPEKFAPTPWEAYTYDANDNAGRTHPDQSVGYQHHWNTPTSVVVDALGRTIETVERNRHMPEAGQPLPPVEEVRTRSTYDIRGNLLTVTDALGREAFRYRYDLANNPLRIDSMDAGVRRTVLDALGNPVERRDSKGALALHAYDILNRPSRLWARDDTGSPVTLRQRLEYGDGSDPDQPEPERETNRQANRLGKLHRHYDEAGLLSHEAYDFKGNLLEKARQVIGDAAILAVFEPLPPDWQIPAFRVDWESQDPANLLDPTEYRTSLAYDALNRVKILRYPQDVDGQRQELRPQYNRAGALASVRLDGDLFVEHIAYNAKGQRTLIAYGNGVITRHAYDPLTFRLAHLRTERYTKPEPTVYGPVGTVPQDFSYAYDMTGNIRAIHDRTPNSGLPAQPHQLDRIFTYDPLYRLRSATGREHATNPPDPPWVDSIKSQDPTQIRAYTERYEYDPVGNMLQLQHQASGGSFTRHLSLTPGSNRLAMVTVGTAGFAYTYDANGNLLQETTSRHFEWDHSDRMKVFRNQVEGSEPPVYAYYLYDAGGQRVKKLVRYQGGSHVEVTVYIDGIFEHHRLIHLGSIQEKNTLHVMDDQSRIAMVRVGAPFPKDPAPAVAFHLGDHLGSSNVVLGSNGEWINREEYTPYGETSFGSFALKRYRFTGKERDEESGLYYHGARYYAPWVARWMSCDPLIVLDNLNLFGYASCNPIQHIDPSGMQDTNRANC